MYYVFTHNYEFIIWKETLPQCWVNLWGLGPFLLKTRVLTLQMNIAWFLILRYLWVTGCHPLSTFHFLLPSFHSRLLLWSTSQNTWVRGNTSGEHDVSKKLYRYQSTHNRTFYWYITSMVAWNEKKSYFRICQNRSKDKAEANNNCMICDKLEFWDLISNRKVSWFKSYQLCKLQSAKAT